MSDHTTEHSDERAQDEEWDLDREWAEARRAAERDAAAQGNDGDQLAEISPFVLLYTGFMLGPPATLLAVLILMGRRFDLRAVAFALGICGAAWGVMQAATFGLAGNWQVVELQVLRTGGNFVVGLVLLWFLGRKTSVAFGHDRQTLINTVVFVLLLIAGYAFLPPSALVWLGR